MSQHTPCSVSRMDGYHLVGCRKPAKVERAGRHYCTIHDPVRVAEKDKARSDKWEAERIQQRKKWAMEAAAPDLLEALKELRQSISIGSSEYGEELSRDVHPETAQKADRAIAKAEGR